MEEHILQIISQRARQRPDENAVSLVHDTAGRTTHLSWAEVERSAWQARHAYRSQGLTPGNRIVLMLPTSEAFPGAFLGALWAGLTPTTLYSYAASSSGTALEQEWRGLIKTFQPAAVVSDHAPADLSVPLIAPATLYAGDSEVPERPDFDDLCSLSYIQFSSGSTGQPKGLALHWSAIHANLTAIVEGAPYFREDCMISWLPLYHDMGLFGGLMMPLFIGARTVLMDPTLFAVNPLLWFRVIQNEQGTSTVTPPSALQSCIELLRRRPQSDLDLSSLNQIVCGAEPISPHLIDGFHEILVPYGVPESALKPVYGMAENTLAVSFPPGYRRPRIDRIERRAFEHDGEARPATLEDDQQIQQWVSAGRPLKGVELRIVDDAGEPLAERQVGHILLHSPSLMSAVLDEGQLTPREGKWLDTGDLGYLADGEIYVTGRHKDLIIKYGRNFAPEHIEALSCLAEGVRRAVAFGLFDEKRLTEQIIILIEGRAKELSQAALRDQLRLTIRAQLHSAGYPVDEIVLVKKGTLPLTTSGKVRRRRCCELYQRQQLELA